MYALGLTGQDRYHAIASDFDIFAGADFFAWLLEHKLEPRPHPPPRAFQNG
jgi:hypothetical protein